MDESKSAGRSGPQAMMDRAGAGAKDGAPASIETARTSPTPGLIVPDETLEETYDNLDSSLEGSFGDDLGEDLSDGLDGDVGHLFAGYQPRSSLDEQEGIFGDAAPETPEAVRETARETLRQEWPQEWSRGSFEAEWAAFTAQARREWAELPANMLALLARVRERAGRIVDLARRGELSSAAGQHADTAARTYSTRVDETLYGLRAWTHTTLLLARERVAAAYEVVAARLRRPATRTPAAEPDLPTAIAPHVLSELATDAQSLQRLAERVQERVQLPVTRRIAQRPVRWASAFLLISILISMLFPALAVLGAVADYNSIKGLADSAVHHLTNAEQDVSGLSSSLGKSKSGSSSSPASTGSSSSTGSTGAGSSLDPASLAKANSELAAARQDFIQLQNRLDHPDWLLSTAYAVPGLSDKMAELQALADVGYDATTIGTDFSSAVLPILTRLKDKGISSSDPLITQSDWNNILHAGSEAQSLMNDIIAKMSLVDINSLPLSAKQKSELSQAIVYLPTAQKAVSQINTLLGAAGWLLGVGQPRNFLVQTLDISELRSSGGFTGNYGVLTISGGKLNPFSLYNINDIEYGYKTNGWIYGKRPPSQYSWWPFANWGLRDSNLSADFPTTAKINEQLFANEGQGQVDGVIQFSPITIAHVLRVTGPIYVPVFNVTVTPDNLQQMIHFYEEDPRGIAIQQRLFPTDHTHSLRKRFTQAVTQLLQDKVKTLPLSQLLEVGKQLLADLQTHDLQIYVNNPQVESILNELHASGSIDTTPGLDGYMLVQSNSSVAKSTPYVNVTQADNVTLDDQGGATHHLTITMQYRPTGPIYGLSTYRDYMRIYLPPQARLISGDGFDSGAPLTSAGGNPYPGGELSCPAGGYNPQDIKSLAFDGASGHLDAIGGPTETTSDVPGRAMAGGWVTIPQWCTARVTLSWYVPSVVHSSAAPANAAPYTYLIQRQGGTFYTMNVTVHPSPAMAANGMQTTTYTAQIDDSMALTLGNPTPIPAERFFNATSLTNVLFGLGGA